MKRSLKLDFGKQYHHCDVKWGDPVWKSIYTDMERWMPFGFWTPICIVVKRDYYEHKEHIDSLTKHS